MIRGFKNILKSEAEKAADLRAQGWIGVDLDGTLAYYDKWISIYHIGAPIPHMVERVRYWIKEGYTVKIFTARVTEIPGQPVPVSVIRKIIQDWCETHIGHRLEVTNIKDFGLRELWDDRAVRVAENTGYPCCDYTKGENK